MKDVAKQKKPKPQRIKCKGGDLPEIRIEGGLEPPASVPFTEGAYRLQGGALYVWRAKG